MDQDDHRGKSEAVEGIAGILQQNVTERTVLEPVRAPRPGDKEESFPKVFKAMPESGKGGEETQGAKPVKKSLFAQRMARKHPEQGQGQGKGVTIDWGSKSRILQGTGLKNPEELAQIHSENVDKLNSLSKAEIEQMRAQIASSLSPDILSFLTKKATGGPSQESERNNTEHSVPMNEDIPAEEAASDVPLVKKIESDKMEWMGELEPIKDIPSTGFSARFDFEGLLLPFNSEDIPVNAGLHHHGEEASRPGYAVGELLLLARSTNGQQKVVAMTTIGKIVANQKRGYFDEVLEQNVLSELLDSGLITVLRMALDDRVESIREASLSCLKQILNNYYDEMVLDTLYFSSLDGHVQPSLASELLKDGERYKEYIEEQTDLKDVEVVNLDVVLGLLRMDLIARLLYILEHLSPSASSKKNILAILIRISRHSLQTAQELTNHQKLTNLIFSFWNDPDVSVEAIKLFRIWISWSKSGAKTLLTKYDIRGVIPKHLVLESGSKGLTLEAFRLWDACLQYGLLTNLFTDLYPIVMKYLLCIRRQIGPDQEEQLDGEVFCDSDIAAALLKTLKSCRPHFRLAEFSDIHEILIDSARTGTRRFMSRADDSVTDKEIHNLLQAVFSTLKENFLSMRKQSDVVDYVERLTTLITDCLCPLLLSQASQETHLLQCKTHSAVLANGLIDGKKRDLKNLPSVGALTWKGEIVPVIGEKSPFSFLRTVTDLLILGMDSKIPMPSLLSSRWFSNPALVDYVTKTCQSSDSHSLVSNWFVTEENQLLWNLLQLSASAKIWDCSVRWNLSQLLLSRMNGKHGSICGTKLLTLALEVALGIEASFQKLNINHAEFSLGNGKAVLELYEDFFPKLHSNNTIDSLTCRHSGEVLLPSDWIYLPLMHKYKTEEEQGQKVSTCLSWISVVLSQESPDTALHFSRLLSVFTSSSSLFLEPQVRSGLLRCVQQLFGNKSNFSSSSRNLNLFANPIPGIDSNRDYFTQILDQFQSVSYGDDCFSLCVILATRQNEDFTRALWVDYAETLRTITLNSEQLPGGSGQVAQFTFAKPSLAVVRALMTGLFSGKVTQKRNPLLHDIIGANLQQAWSVNDSQKIELEKMYPKLTEFGINLPK